MIFGCTISMKVPYFQLPEMDQPLLTLLFLAGHLLASIRRCKWTALLGSLGMLIPPNFCKTVGISSLTLLTETFIARRSMITSLTSSTYLPFSNVVMVSSSSKQGSCSNSLFYSLSSPALNSSFKMMAVLCSFNKPSSLACVLLCL